MKEVCFEATVPGCSTRDFYEIACSEPTALLEFHRKVNKDNSVEVAWEDDSKKARLCTYTLQTIAIPASLQSFVGAGPIMVKEKQVFTWLDKDTLQIVSRPMVQIKYGKAMKTEAEMTLRSAGDGCQFDVKARVTARLPWAMQYLTSSIEMMMAAEARRTVASYVNFITKFVQDGLPGLREQRRQQQQEQELVVAAGEEQQQQAEEMMLDLAGSEASGSEAGAEAVIIQQHTAAAALAAAPGAGKPSAALAAAATTLQLQATAGSAAALAPPAPAPAAAAAAAAVPARAAVSSGDSEVFYDAQEVTRTDALLEALLRELQAAKEQRAAANRLLEEVRDSVLRTEVVVTKEVAFQEGVRFAQRGSSTTLMLSVAAAAATASAVTAMLVARRSK